MYVIIYSIIAATSLKTKQITFGFQAVCLTLIKVCENKY